MSRLIKDLLNYSMLSDGRVSFEDIDLNVVMDSVTSYFELLIEERGAVSDMLICRLSEELPFGSSSSRT
jgi:light-regulated signal transduction histidine kinase (bacteriophytochrome)